MNILYCYFTVLDGGDVCHILLLIFGSFRYSKRMRLFYKPPFLQVSQSIVSMIMPVLYATFLAVSKSGIFHTPPFFTSKQKYCLNGVLFSVYTMIVLCK